VPRPPIDWLVTDTHWFHDKCAVLSNRPADFTEKTIKNLRHLLAPQDTLWHLGDVILYKYEKLKEILDSIPGRKILLMGNHDRKKRNWYCTHGFAAAMDQAVLGKLLLTHKPTPVANGLKNIPEWWSPGTHKLLSLEEANYSPVKLQEFTAKWE
jgi:calcineurin-like phosphoesterase family protein